MNDSNDVNSCEEASPVWLVHIGSHWFTVKFNDLMKPICKHCSQAATLPSLKRRCSSQVNGGYQKSCNQSAWTHGYIGYRIQRDSHSKMMSPTLQSNVVEHCLLKFWIPCWITILSIRRSIATNLTPNSIFAPASLYKVWIDFPIQLECEGGTKKKG